MILSALMLGVQEIPVKQTLPTRRSAIRAVEACFEALGIRLRERVTRPSRLHPLFLDVAASVPCAIYSMVFVYLRDVGYRFVTANCLCVDIRMH